MLGQISVISFVVGLILLQYSFEFDLTPKWFKYVTVFAICTPMPYIAYIVFNGLYEFCIYIN